MIRWRQPGDVPGIVELVRTELVPLSTRTGMSSRRLRREVTARLKRGATLVAARSARSGIFAFVHLEIRGPVLFIDLLAVNRSQQRHNWGTLLMRRAEAYAVMQGCTEARLFVDDTNERGLRFYGRLGYAAVQHIPGARCYEMYRPLGLFWP